LAQTLAEKRLNFLLLQSMNKILSLFDENYVRELFTEKVLPLYPNFSGIEKIEIKPYKKMVWNTTYHVVISYYVYFTRPDRNSKKIFIVCSAHSEEPRDNVFRALEFLWKHNFNQEYIHIPRPLFYSEYFRGIFYRGIKGETLLHYIKNAQHQEVEKLLPLAAEAFVRLHQLPAGTATNFNPINSRIRTVIPGVNNILREMSLRYQGKFDRDLIKIYDYLIAQEDYFFKKHLSLNLIHGDAHTENIIKIGEGRIGLIDFTDFCLGDFARDLGTFLQQLEYKVIIKLNDKELAEKFKKIFLDSYLEIAGIKHSAQLEKRIRLYYNWTAIRTVVFLFLKHDSDPQRGEALLNKVKKDLNIN